MNKQTIATETWTLVTPAGENVGSVNVAAGLATNGEKEARNLACLSNAVLVTAIVKSISKHVGYNVRLVRCIPSSQTRIFVTFCHAQGEASLTKLTKNTRTEAKARGTKVAPVAPAITRPVVVAATKSTPATKPAVKVSIAKAPKTTRTLNTQQRNLVTRLQGVGYSEREAIAIATKR